MSSGFVSSGTTDAPIERDDEWLKAQQEIEANRRREEEDSRHEGGKTLYEVLQGNKGDYHWSWPTPYTISRNGEADMSGVVCPF